MDIYSEINCVKGVGPKTKEMFNKCGIYTILDLILYFPRTYEGIHLSHEYKIVPNEINIIKAKVAKISGNISKNGRVITSIIFNDGKNTIRCVWFNTPYIKKYFMLNKSYILRGKIEIYKNNFYIFSPKIINNQNFNMNNEVFLEPRYSLKGSITNNIFIKTIDNIFNTTKFNENLPESILKKYNLCDFNSAIVNIHRPKNVEFLNRSLQRLKFQEIFTYCLKILLIKDDVKKNNNGFSFKVSPELDDFISKIPFKLTGAQSRVMYEILHDEKKNKPMNRLLQGDVGSGKTIVAFIAMFNVVKNGFQVAMMAPTEILAEQHYNKIKSLIQRFNINTELLTSSIKKSKKSKIKDNLLKGSIDILIGTQALLEDDVKFKNLGLVVTDEQHRFGVMQRNKLINKNKNIDVLVMTATPIPRTLSLYLYGDLDISVINELPPNRKTIETYYVTDSYRDRVYNFALKYLQQGRQVYVVCPLIEENSEMNLASVQKIYNSIKDNYFKNYKIGILHGKMNGKDKQSVMDQFKNGQFNVIVSTTVIEVGIDVPNATIMIIENAERFGLSQLHQLRGRVGRGEKKSYCILIANIKSENTKKRMDIIKNSNDGFYIAEEDLKLRGSGELLGLRQHGDNGLILCDITKDFEIVKRAHSEAKLTYQGNTIDDIKLKKDILKRLDINCNNICFN